MRRRTSERTSTKGHGRGGQRNSARGHGRGNGNTARREYARRIHRMRSLRAPLKLLSVVGALERLVVVIVAVDAQRAPACQSRGRRRSFSGSGTPANHRPGLPDAAAHEPEADDILESVVDEDAVVGGLHHLAAVLGGDA